MSDDLPEFTCPDCDFRFSVIWNTDWERAAMCHAGKPVLNYCPCCGEEFDFSSQEDE